MGEYSLSFVFTLFGSSVWGEPFRWEWCTQDSIPSTSTADRVVRSQENGVGSLPARPQRFLLVTFDPNKVFWFVFVRFGGWFRYVVGQREPHI